jgi:hypothetical protein
MSSPTSRHRRAALIALLALAGCREGGTTLASTEQSAIADSLAAMFRAAYDLRQKDPIQGFMSLYPDSGRVVSASGGRVTTTRDSLEAGIRTFWETAGRNMQDPEWTWGRPQVDVLSRDAAVITTTYRVPHRTPAGAPHVIAGAWTAVFVRRDGRWVVIQEHLSELPATAAAVQPAARPGDAHTGHGSRP